MGIASVPKYCKLGFLEQMLRWVWDLWCFLDINTWGEKKERETERVSAVQTQHSFGWPNWKLRRKFCTSECPTTGCAPCAFNPLLLCILSHCMWIVSKGASHQARWLSGAEAETSVKEVTSGDSLQIPCPPAGWIRLPRVASLSICHPDSVNGRL